MLALRGGRPEVMDLKAIVAAFIDFREEVVTRRTAFRLGKARDRAHLLVGLAIAVANIDPVIELIRAAPDRSEEHTSELQSLMRISYAVFCLKKKKTNIIKT